MFSRPPEAARPAFRDRVTSERIFELRPHVRKRWGIDAVCGWCALCRLFVKRIDRRGRAFAVLGWRS